MIRWYADIHLDQHSIHTCPDTSSRMFHRCILNLIIISYIQPWVSVYLYVVFSLYMSLEGFNKKQTKQNQKLLKCITYGFFLILSNLKIVDIFILCSPTSEQTLKSLSQYFYFYFDCANVS